MFLEADDVEAVQQAPRDPEREGEEIGGQAAKEVDRGSDIGDSQQPERGRFVDSRQLEDDGRRERADHHENRIQRIDRADHAGAMVLAGPGLHRGENRSPRTAPPRDE